VTRIQARSCQWHILYTLPQPNPATFHDKLLTINFSRGGLYTAGNLDLHWSDHKLSNTLNDLAPAYTQGPGHRLCKKPLSLDTELVAHGAQSSKMVRDCRIIWTAIELNVDSARVYYHHLHVFIHGYEHKNNIIIDTKGNRFSVTRTEERVVVDCEISSTGCISTDHLSVSFL